MSTGIMFHHFHGKNFPHMQGSISSSDFISIIKYLKNNYNLLDADNFKNKFYLGKLKKKDICLTFDDCLKSQIKIALPVLKKFKIKAFFFIYSSIFGNKLDKFESYRDFRSTFYKTIDHFYLDFFSLIKKKLPKENEKFLKQYKKDYLKKFSFYSLNDRKYRFYRDVILSKKKYESLMNTLMLKKNYNPISRKNKILMNKSDIISISKNGHEIGLHSHTHPIRIDLLNLKEQNNEYKVNQKILKKLIKKDITSMSHPCGRYNKDSIKVLKNLNIKIGFRSNIHQKKIKSCFEIPRIDHIDILRKLKKTNFIKKQ